MRFHDILDKFVFVSNLNECEIAATCVWAFDSCQTRLSFEITHYEQ